MYSSVDDMVERWGQAKMIRLSAPEGDNLGAIDSVRVAQALTDASDLIDSYLRKRYAVPLAVPPSAVMRAAAVLARYDLSTRGDLQASDQVRKLRSETMEWLKVLADGVVTLDGLEPSGDYSGAMTQDRRPEMRGLRQGRSGIFREGWPE